MSILKYLRGRLPAIETIRDKSDPRCLEIYRLRYLVNVEQQKITVNPNSVYQSNVGKIICDDFDESDATTHFAFRNNQTGKIVSSFRSIDANKTKLDMERYGWFKIDPKLKEGGLVENSRLVSDISVRKTIVAPLLFVEGSLQIRDNGINNVIMMVDSRATNLIKYYKRWTMCREISNGAVGCDEYEVGRKSHVMLGRMGLPDTVDRMIFDTRVVIPALVGIGLMKR